MQLIVTNENYEKKHKYLAIKIFLSSISLVLLRNS